MEEAAKKVATWERHGQTILLGIVAAALSFTGKFLFDVKGQLSEIVNENKHLALQVARMEGTISAMQANYITRNEFSPYVERIRNLERKTEPRN